MNIDGGCGYPTGDAYSSWAPGPTSSLPGIRKIMEYLRNKEWITEEAEGKVTGNVSLVIKYNIPLDMEFTLPKKGVDCYAIKKMYGTAKSGVYNVSLDDMTVIQAYCDMDTAGGGWTVFQRRQDGTVDFYRTWRDYKFGFGDPAAEHWLGNEKLHLLTNRNKMCELYISMESWNNVVGYAKYNNFSIEDESNAYRLHIGSFTGNNVGQDSLRYHNNMKFGTKDSDNDRSSSQNCATDTDYGAWWYDSCDYCGLNGLYNDTSSDRGIEWNNYPGGSMHMKFTQMMVRCE
ncbi:hypothetical protein FSP39_001025 [Pinctada imbricata]|uniref:Fibrinogen C-terminal domain-containing protein n=1 Tax=Pinctada imbricata TaxID=66713 RepID=A0AA89C7Q4_PINIB|nr:hypothetical protein FSP39_001025 [Pinctada imbricata]